MGRWAKQKRGPQAGLVCQCEAILGSIYMPVKNINLDLYFILNLKLGFTGKMSEWGQFAAKIQLFLF